MGADRVVSVEVRANLRNGSVVAADRFVETRLSEEELAEGDVTAGDKIMAAVHACTEELKLDLYERGLT